MSIEKVREEYEAWVLSKYPNQHMGRFATGEYHSTVIEHCWQAWQASREAMVLELPNRFDEKYQEYFEDVEGGSFNESIYLADVDAVLRAAGVKVSQ